MNAKEIEAIIAQYPLRDVREIVLAVAVRVHDAALEEAADVGVDGILDDLTNRRGLKQEWHQIDADEKLRIIEDWRDIVRKRKVKP